jgi:UDP-N-acetyl-D-galactosamine dehydrogenase
VSGSKVIVLGLTFKENCPDIRNSKVADVIRELKEFGCEVFVHDPLASNEEARHEYGVNLTEWDMLPRDADAVVLAVPHRGYLEMEVERLLGCTRPSGVVIDVKSVLDRSAVSATGRTLWRL